MANIWRNSIASLAFLLAWHFAGLFDDVVTMLNFHQLLLDTELGAWQLLEEFSCAEARATS